MAILKTLLPLLAIAGTVVAQCSDGTNNIQNSGDAMKLQSCTTLSGDVVISANTTDPITLTGIQIINGSLICEGQGLSTIASISAPTLQTIGGSFNLSQLTALSTLSFPQLTKVQNISWIALPQLQSLNFSPNNATGGVIMANSVVISNTGLKSLDGINLQTVDTFNINNNPDLTKVNPVQLREITGPLDIEANGKALIASFPALQVAFNMTFKNCSDVQLPALSVVNDTMGFFGNAFQSADLNNLTSTGKDLVFVGNDQLTNISAPSLTKIGGGYLIANNTQLTMINGFKALQTVGGALDFSGDFSDVELPALTEVYGGFNLQSSGNFSCSAFDKDHSNGVIRGTYTCKGDLQNPGTAANPNPTTKKSAAPSLVMSQTLGFIVLVTGAFSLLM
ncbi:MAG: hypothetical protein M1824_006041 [Vezdaea acicularis]|nr:MAG: hypothetical protein M1824_006041 [Vezdaea acicularis]